MVEKSNRYWLNRSEPSDPLQDATESAMLPDSRAPAEPITGKLLTTMGGGLITGSLGPIVAVVLKTEIPWLVAGALILGCWTVGAFLMAVGLSWPRLRPKNETFVSWLNAAANNFWVWAVVLVVVAFGPALILALASSRQIMVVHDGPTTAEIIASIGSIKTQLDAATAERDVLKSQLDVRTKELNAARQGMPPTRFPIYGSGAILKGKLARAEAEDLVKLLTDFASIVQNSPTEPSDLFPRNGRFDTSGPVFFPTSLQKDGLPKAIERLTQFKNDLATYFSDIESKTNVNNRDAKYATYLFAIVRGAGDANISIGKNEVQGSIEQYIRQLNLIAKQSPPVTFEITMAALADFPVQGGRALQNFHQWKNSFINERVPAAQKEIRDYL